MLNPFLYIPLQNCQLRDSEDHSGGSGQCCAEQDPREEVGAEEKNKSDLDDGQHCLLPGLGSYSHLPAGG